MLGNVVPLDSITALHSPSITSAVCSPTPTPQEKVAKIKQSESLRAGLTHPGRSDREAQLFPGYIPALLVCSCLKPSAKKKVSFLLEL